MNSPAPINRRLSCLFGFTFTVTSSFILCRAIADAVLLSRLGPEALASTLILSSIVVGLVSFSWSRLTSGLSLRWVAAITQITTAVLTLLVLLLLEYSPYSTFAIVCLYLLAEVRGGLGAILIAVSLNEGTRRNADKRHFALVNAGAPIAGLAIGLFLGFEATQIRSDIFIFICVLFDMAAWAFLHFTSDGATIATKETKPGHEDGKRPLRKYEVGFGRALLLLVACKVGILAFVSYEWRIVAEDFFAGNEQQLTAYFGLFYAMSDALIIVVHLILSQRELRKRRIVATLFGLPLYLGVIGALSLVAPGPTMLFILVTLARGATVIRRGLHDVVIQVLFGWLPEDSRRASITRVVGIAKPAVEAGVALIILVLSWMAPVNALAWMWFPLVFLWGAAIFRLLHHWKKLAKKTSAAATNNGDRAVISSGNAS